MTDDALEELIRVHGAGLFARFHRFLRDRGAAEDLRQEVFFAAAETLRRGERPDNWGAWLRTVGARKVVDHVRRRAVRLAAEQEAAEEARAGGGIDVPRPAADFEDELGALPLLERTVVLLAYQEGRSITEIAALLDAPEGTVKTWLYRARNRLRPRFQGGAP